MPREILLNDYFYFYTLWEIWDSCTSSLPSIHQKNTREKYKNIFDTITIYSKFRYTFRSYTDAIKFQ